MKNVHERILSVPLSTAGRLIDGLAGDADELWPCDRWPRMVFDRPLAVGATGGHGPIGYSVVSFEPGSVVRFEFYRPRGFDGTHEFRLQALDDGRCRLSHTIDAKLTLPMWVKWVVTIRPLHDALLEDALDRAERACGTAPLPRSWSPWVRFLRRLVARRSPNPKSGPTGVR